MTGNNPVGFLRTYHAFGSREIYGAIHRHGFYRAEVTFPMSIMYGLFFAMFGPVCVGLLKKKTDSIKAVYYAGIIFMGVGIFASVSSGAILAGVLAGSFILFYRYRSKWKVVVAGLIVMCFLVEILSNRHFYDVAGRFTLNPATAWYRGRLMEVALLEGGMSGHWLTGYGLADPGWGPSLGLGHTDITNNYLFVLCRYGLVGFIPFCALTVMAINELIKAFRASLSETDKWLIWCLSGAFCGVLGAAFSVALFGQPFTVYYMMIGFAGVMPAIVANQSSPNGMIADTRLSYTSKSMFSLYGSRIY
jgi:hypothetical protein